MDVWLDQAAGEWRPINPRLQPAKLASGIQKFDCGPSGSVKSIEKDLFILYLCGYQMSKNASERGFRCARQSFIIRFCSSTEKYCPGPLHGYPIIAREACGIRRVEGFRLTARLLRHTILRE